LSVSRRYHDSTDDVVEQVPTRLTIESLALTTNRVTSVEPGVDLQVTGRPHWA
jgi:hypothetical protein